MPQLGRRCSDHPEGAGVVPEGRSNKELRVRSTDHS